MAREKTKVRTFTMPKEAPEGMVFEDVKRTIGDDKNQVVRVLVPKPNGAGVNGSVKFLSGILPADGGDGTVFVAEAVRNAMVTSQIAQAGSNEVSADDAGSIVPRIARLTTVDKGQVAGARLMKFIEEHGRAPNSTENREIYSGLSL